MNRNRNIKLLIAFSFMMISCPMALHAEQTLIPTYIDATSTLGEAYVPANIQDYNLETAWVEGAEGNGLGETVRYHLPEGTVLTGGEICPGYQKSEDLFYKNAAPFALQISSGDVSERIFCSYAANSWLGDDNGKHRFVFENPIVSDGIVKVKILDVREGWMYEDTCISELKFFGYTAGNEAGYQSGDNGWNDSGDGTWDSQTQNGEWSPNGNNKDGNNYTSDPEMISPEWISQFHLSGLAYRVYDLHSAGPALQEGTVYADDLSIEDMAFLLYWYQYSCGDPRIGQAGNEYHCAYIPDMQEIAGELFGEENEQEVYDMFEDRYASYTEGELIYMNSTGDFGDAGSWYFEAPDEVWTEDDDAIVISGRVMVWNSNAQTYIHNDMYTARYYQNETYWEGQPLTFRLDWVQVGY